MNLRKSIYFKPLCLLVAVLFMAQCVSIQRKLVSTEEKVMENESREFIYEYEKIKTPSTQDPTVEYKIVKFPAKRVETIFIFEQVKKVNRFPTSLLTVVAGAALGTGIGQVLVQDSCVDFGKPIFGFGIGTLVGLFASVAVVEIVEKKGGSKKEFLKKHAGSRLEKEPNSLSIPLQNYPLEFVWAQGKRNVFKTQTNEQGIVKINLIDDLKMAKFPLDKPLILYINYLNPETQKNAVFGDSLGPTQ